MASMATGAGHLSSLAMDTSPKLISGNGRSKGMLFDKYRIRMAAVACPLDVGNVCHGFVILTLKNVMFSVTVITIGCSFHPLHDHLGMEALQILLLCLLVASCTVHPFVRRLLPTLGVFIIFNPGMAI
jgi:hypothetical protein